MAEKAVYSLTESGEAEFENLMHKIAAQPVNIFLDFNAVIVNLDSLSLQDQEACLTSIESNIKTLKSYLEENITEKEDNPQIPETGKAVLRQQMILAQAIETWIGSVKISISEKDSRPS